MSIVVFGSLNMDLVTRTPRLPQPGETLTGYSFVTVPGGKGANQAVAIARLGVPVQMVGRVGDDRFSSTLVESLQAAGVGCDGIQVDDSTSSGVATIAIDDQGENHIIIVPGANGQVDLSDVERLPPAKVFAAARSNATIILDPAPAPTELPDELYAIVDILTPNQLEAEQLTGIAVRDQTSASAAAKVLRGRGVGTVIVKMGGRGALCATAEGEFFVPPFPVTAIDTVAAGDAFNGALAAALVEGRPLAEACRWGAAAGAIAVTRIGAQSAMPTRAELMERLNQG
jgi:ribokinase